jgi:hypothetical protein
MDFMGVKDLYTPGIRRAQQKAKEALKAIAEKKSAELQSLSSNLPETVRSNITQALEIAGAFLSKTPPVWVAQNITIPILIWALGILGAALQFVRGGAGAEY